MPITDLFTKATNTSRPTPTTLTAIKGVGASSLSAGSLTGWPTDTAIHFVIYQIDTTGAKVPNSQTDWKGVVSGSTITNLTLKAGSDTSYPIGSIVEAAPTAAWANDLVTGLTAQHNQDGTHSAVTATSVSTTNLTVTGTTPGINPSVEYDSADRIANYIKSGTGVVAISAGLVGTFSNITYYIAGQRYTASSIANKTYTASKDTYVDIDTTGTVTYSEVTNNAASPSLAANSIRVAIVVTSGSAITVVNQGSTSATGPTVSGVILTVTDSIGNPICPKNPNPKLVAFRRVANGGSGGSTSYSAVCTTPFIAVAGQRYKVTGQARFGCFNTTQNTIGVISINDSVDGGIISGDGGLITGQANQNETMPCAISVFTASTSGLRNLSLGFSFQGGFQMSAWNNASIIIEPAD